MDTLIEVPHNTVMIHRQRRRPAATAYGAYVAIEDSRSSSKLKNKHIMGSIPNFTQQEWQASAAEVHPFISVIREAVERYRLQSAAHYNIDIDVHQSDYDKNPDEQQQVSPSFKVRVGFHNFGRGPIERMCGPGSRRKSRKGPRIMTGALVVYEKGTHVPLEQFLVEQFPLHEAPVGSDIMYRWWRENDKMFNWKALPTELKENIIRHCLHDKPLPANISLRMGLKPSTKKSKAVHKAQRRGPHEVTDNFNQTSSLLRVSHQVRAIALRLCLQGSTGRESLCVDVTGGFALKECIRRLGKCLQMSHPNGVPMDERTEALAKLYKLYPRIYPHLDQYATFAHGIRKVYVRMDYHSYFRFFKVTVGGFRSYWRPIQSTYELLEQLPNLHDIVIELPDPRGRLSDQSRTIPPLFYPDFECPRILHRFIYEQVAEVLALYPNVTITGFVDDLEEQRFYILRSAAVHGLNFTSVDLADLYKDDGGGIELESMISPGLPISEQEDLCAEPAEFGRVHDPSSVGFWPPKCRCAVACRKVLYPEQ
ncbi:hypothetical protein NX059_005734 [Plenodomus lindquistii]|nr:hypothetical protein NX059_005734 [Plenodomus lindquistii]